jgi:pyridoxine 5-phosphate synthase
MTERRLIVNLDGVAMLRGAGGGQDPDPVAAATLALLAGADGVSVQLREDRRSIQDRDARVLRQTVRRGFGMEIAAAPEVMKVALEIRPDAITLVGDLPHERAGAAGIDVAAQIGALGDIVRALQDGKIAASLLVAPDLEQVKCAHRVGARGVRLDAGRFAEDGPDRDKELERLQDAARLAAKLGLAVSVGGALDYENVRRLLPIAEISEFHASHAICARALLLGIERAVREMKELLA